MILRRIISNDSVFDPRNEAVVNELSNGFWFEVAFEFDIKDGWFPQSFNKLAKASGDAGISRKALHRKNHYGGKVEVTKSGNLIHHRAISWTNGWDNKGILCAFCRDDFEGFCVFAGGDVVEVCIASVKKRGDASGFNMTDDFSVFSAVDFEFGITGQRGDRNDRRIELLGSNW